LDLIERIAALRGASTDLLRGLGRIIADVSREDFEESVRSIARLMRPFSMDEGGAANLAHSTPFACLYWRFVEWFSVTAAGSGVPAEEFLAAADELVNNRRAFVFPPKSTSTV